MRSQKSIILCYVTVFALASFAVFNIASVSAQPVINEVMSANTSTIQDTDGDYPDWIEIYNPGASAVNLNGYGLSDDPGEPYKWVFPDYSLVAGGYLLVFASDKNLTTLSGGAFHTNFKIKSEGETLVLTNPSGIVADSLSTGVIAVDVSRGRQPDGSSTLVFFAEPSPGESNTAEPITGYAGEVVMSNPGGLYNSGKSIVLSTVSDAATIRYTLDGSWPSETSTAYTGAISISGTTVLRARAFEDGKFPGTVVTNTYLINEDSDLPIISISLNPDDLWDDDIGIYVRGNSTTTGGYEVSPTGTGNYNEDWEKPIHIEFYEPNGTQGFSIDAGMKISGKTTRHLPQKGLAIFARSEYGYNEIDYKIFPDLPVSSFKSIVLRAGGSEQNNGRTTMFRDGLHQTLMQPLDLEVQGYRPAVVFLNGEYWGIHNIHEKLNEDYLASYHGVDPDEVDMIDDYHAVFVNAKVVNEYYSGASNWTCFVIEGTADHYNALLRYMLDHDESVPEAYEYIKTQIDIDNYIDYMASRIFIADPDGPGHNTKMWRPQTEDGKWRWLMYDTDYGSGLQPGSFGIKKLNGDNGPTAEEQYLADYYMRLKQTDEGRSPDANFLMYSLLANNEFKARFLNRYADHLNTIFSTEVTIPVVERIAAAIQSEMPRHIQRWGNESFGAKDMNTWNENVDIVKQFFELRPGYVRENVAAHEFVNVSGSADVTLNVSNASMGKIQISSLIIDTFPWTGTYFKDVPIRLTALPAPGYAFAGWTGAQSSDSAVIDVTLSEAITMTANFVEDSSAHNSIVINEINYNSAPQFPVNDWLELYNAYGSPIDLSGWILKDSGNVNSFDIPGGTIIPAGGYLVLSNDLETFKMQFPDIDNVVGDFGFGLDNAGEYICLYNPVGEIVDSLTYDDANPWPEAADGTGPALALISPELDNSVAENWTYSIEYGTPGVSNDIPYSSVGDEVSSPAAFSLGQNFPNPFNPVTTIPFSLAESGHVTIEVYNILGRSVGKIVDDYMTSGSYNAIFRSTGLSAGIYIYTIKTGNYTETRQMTLLK